MVIKKEYNWDFEEYQLFSTTINEVGKKYCYIWSYEVNFTEVYYCATFKQAKWCPDEDMGLSKKRAENGIHRGFYGMDVGGTHLMEW